MRLLACGMLRQQKILLLPLKGIRIGSIQCRFRPMEPYDPVDAYFGLLEDLRAILGEQVDLVVSGAVKNRYIARDIKTGEYEINADDLVATKRLLAKHPNAVIYGLRIGYPTAYRIRS